VAVKILPEAFAQDPARLARFDREARALAALNHPGIAGIHGIEEADSGRFLVLELVEGETLAARLSRGPLPVEEALSVCRQIAEALEVAHEKGLIHRDLKPGNVMVTPDEKVKLLDFGLAKRIEGEPSDSDPESPTLPRPPTGEGVILGTAAYMSPEQARGKPLDRRTDIWSFGCVLYEALTGRRAFGGEGVSDSLAAVLDREPDWEALPPATPTGVLTLLTRCLRKDRAKRLHDIADVGIELEEALDEPPTAGHDAAPDTARLSSRLGWWGLTTVAALAIGAGTAWTLRPTVPRPVTKVTIGVEHWDWHIEGDVSPWDSRLGRVARTAMALSPDGRTLVYSGGDAESCRLYLRPMDRTEAKPIPGTEGGLSPFFSPDGEWVGFWAEGQLRKVRMAGGPPVPLCEALRPYGASWGDDDTIVFGQYQGGILRIPSEGGIPETITTVEEGRWGHHLPQLLPGAAALLYTDMEAPSGLLEGSRIVAQSLETGDRKVVVEDATDARYVPTGHLVFCRRGALMATLFDPAGLQTSGGAVVVLEGVKHAVNLVALPANTGAGQFSFSASGSLVYVPGGISPGRENSLDWVSRKGVADPLPVRPASYAGPRISPDGQRVVMNVRSQDREIWVHDLSRGTSTLLSAERLAGDYPVWTPDGTRVAFRGVATATAGIYWMPSDGSGSAEELTTLEGRSSMPASWSPDGQVLAFVAWSALGKGNDIWMLPRAAEPRPFIESPFDDHYPEFSPDGRWVAYVSDRSRQTEVYATPYPGPGPRVQVSSDGGSAPTWSRDGRELFYRGLPDGDGLRSMYVVDVKTEPTLTVGTPRELFSSRHGTRGALRGYDVAPDGQRFLMVRLGPLTWVEPVTEFHLILNWFEELKRRVPTE